MFGLWASGQQPLWGIFALVHGSNTVILKSDPWPRLPWCAAVVRGRARSITGNPAGARAIATTALALLVMALGMADLQAAGSGKVRTVEELRAALSQNRFAPLAF